MQRDVLRCIGRNAIQPSVKRTVAAKIGERSIGFDKSLLSYIFNLSRVVQVTRNKLRYPPLILQDQKIERASLLFCALYELVVTIAECQSTASHLTDMALPLLPNLFSVSYDV